MIDTVKLGIPLTHSQFKRIQDSVLHSSTPQWATFHPDTGEIRLRRVIGLANTDQNSFHREIRWDLPYYYSESGTYLTVELSLPKLYYGQNINLLYDYVKGLEVLKQTLEANFGFKGRGKLISPYEWELWRVDCCYAWKCPSELTARQVLRSITDLKHFPRKKPNIHPDESIMFAGSTYSLKFYLKLPEFKKHDKKALSKAKASIEWIDYCEKLATGVLRIEATLRRKYLKKRGICKVADLLNPVKSYDFDLSEYPEDYDFDSATVTIISYQMEQIDSELGDWEFIQEDAKDGQYFDAPEGYELEIWGKNGKIDYRHNGKGFILRKTDQPVAILQYLLTKFLGVNPAMQYRDEVEAKLNETFKPVKAARLMGMWLYVQSFGIARAKEAFGKDSYYAARRDMSKAGVSLVEPSKNVVNVDANFWKKFRLEVPNEEYVVNREDEFRDSGSILNLPKAASDS